MKDALDALPRAISSGGERVRATASLHRFSIVRCFILFFTFLAGQPLGRFTSLAAADLAPPDPTPLQNYSRAEFLEWAEAPFLQRQKTPSVIGPCLHTMFSAVPPLFAPPTRTQTCLLATIYQKVSK